MDNTDKFIFQDLGNSLKKSVNMKKLRTLFCLGLQIEGPTGLV